MNGGKWDWVREHTSKNIWKTIHSPPSRMLNEVQAKEGGGICVPEVREGKGTLTQKNSGIA